jgi:hypothetical protein
MSNKPKQLQPSLTPLPCPFCGSNPRLRPKNPEVEGNAWGAVACTNSRCHAQPMVNDEQTSADERGTGAYIDAAIKRWNKRPPHQERK